MLHVKIRERSWLAKLAARKLRAEKAAIVFGRTIYLHGTNKEEFLTDQQWVRHELKHVEQYNRFGLMPFLVMYLVESLKKGYDQNKFEVEARKSENDNGIDTKFELI